MQANLNNLYASSARKAAFFQAGSSLLSGFGQAKAIG